MSKGFKAKQTYLGESRHMSVRKVHQRDMRKKSVTKMFPVTEPFHSREELEEYLSGDTIQCLICGREFKCQLGVHIAVHGINRHEYKKRYNIPDKTGLVTKAWHEKKSSGMKPEQLDHFKKIIRPGKPKGIKISINWLKAEHKSTLRAHDGNRKMSTGESHWYSVLKDMDVINIREEHKNKNGKYGTIARLAREYKVSEGCIREIVKNRTWTHLLPSE